MKDRSTLRSLFRALNATRKDVEKFATNDEDGVAEAVERFVLDPASVQ